MKNQQALGAQVNALSDQADSALRAGRGDQAFSLWQDILGLDPLHVRTLHMIGQHSLRKGDFASARAAFRRVVDGSGAAATPQQWVQLAVACQALQDEAGEEDAIRRALCIDPQDLLALVLRAQLLERQGKQHEAAGVYGAVAAVAPPMEQLHPDLRPAVTQALRYQEAYQRNYGAFIDDFLASHYGQYQGEDLGRFRDSVDIMLGRKRRFESRSMMFHFAGLKSTEIFPRARFPWLDQIEAGTDTIRDEFLAVLKAEPDFVPYLTYADDVPHNQFAELNNSPRWSAYHLWQDGKPVPAHAARCPQTMHLLSGAPQPDQPNRTPTAMFSLLQPNTHIPPHVGVSNVRLVCHLPLIVPEQCGFRCGNTTRGWTPGEAFVFDDTIEHEAWNRSDRLRVVLIFDIWHPDLTLAERAMLTAMTDGIHAFRGQPGGFAL